MTRLRRPIWRRVKWAAVLLMAILSLDICAAAVPATTPPNPSRMLAILIGVSRYNRLTDVSWSDKDVELVRETLQRWCRCDPNDIVVMTIRSPEHFKPNRGNILAVLDHRLGQAARDGFDRVLIYFAGHGLKDAEGHLYLAPQDYARSRIQDTGLRVSEFREALGRCDNIGTKFLILDACYAGETRGESSVSLSKDIGVELRGTHGLLTLAACQPDEQSMDWHDMRQGLFTYWLCRGLSGDADAKPCGNNNGLVDTDELGRFVVANVESKARELGHQQKPSLITSADWRGPATLAVLSDAGAERELARQAWRCVEQSLKYRNGGNLDDALEELERAFRLNASEPEPRELFALRGRFQVEHGKLYGNPTAFGAALLDLDHAIAQHHPAAPPHELAAFYALRCEANFALKQYEAALRDADKVIEFEPRRAQAFRNRGMLRRILGQVQQAEEDNLQAAALSSAVPASPESADDAAVFPTVETVRPLAGQSVSLPAVEGESAPP